MEVKDIVILDNNKEYSVIKKVENYYVLLSLETPLEIVVGVLEKDTLKVVQDKNIIFKVLSEN